jgi:hypothetical protein
MYCQISASYLVRLDIYVGFDNYLQKVLHPSWCQYGLVEVLDVVYWRCHE